MFLLVGRWKEVCRQMFVCPCVWVCTVRVSVCPSILISGARRDGPIRKGEEDKLDKRSAEAEKGFPGQQNSLSDQQMALLSLKGPLVGHKGLSSALKRSSSFRFQLQEDFKQTQRLLRQKESPFSIETRPFLAKK